MIETEEAPGHSTETQFPFLLHQVSEECVCWALREKGNSGMMM